MQIVIDIPEYVYCDIQAYKTIFSDKIESVSKAIIDGVLLPKGHGDLIDADQLYDYIVDKYSEGEQLAIDILDAPTVIEADTSGKEQK